VHDIILEADKIGKVCCAIFLAIIAHYHTKISYEIDVISHSRLPWPIKNTNTAHQFILQVPTAAFTHVSQRSLGPSPV